MVSSFQDFCVQLATSNPITINMSDTDVPDVYKSRLDNLIANLKPKMDILDKIRISYIQSALSDEKVVKTRLDNNLVDGDIPDSIINKLSTELYGKVVTMLTNEQIAIIKCLSVYISLQL